MNCKRVKTYLYTMEWPQVAVLPEKVQDHLRVCEACRAEWAYIKKMSENFSRLGQVTPPRPVLDHYVGDVLRKIRQHPTASPQSFSIQNWERWFRPALAALSILLIVISVWWFGIRRTAQVESDSLMTESLDYYLESFQKEAAQNSVAVVKGLEYQWAFSSNIRRR